MGKSGNRRHFTLSGNAHLRRITGWHLVAAENNGCQSPWHPVLDATRHNPSLLL